MRALRIHQHGPPEVLVVDQTDDPGAPGPGQARVRVHVAALNHLDLFVRRGMPGVRIPMPRILCSDGAGVVEGVGEDVSDFRPGDRVVFDPAHWCARCAACLRGRHSLCEHYRLFGEHRDGLARDVIIVQAAQLFAVPDHVALDSAAAGTLAALTAYSMIVGKAGLEPGETVLIHGAGGGVGVFCVQLARLQGATVIATAGSEEKLAALRSLGADFVLDHRVDDLAGAVRALVGRGGVDAVVDCVGKATWHLSLKLCRRGGRILTCGATTGFDPVEDLRHIFFRQLRIIGSTMGSRHETEAAWRLLFSGRLQAPIHARFPLEQAVAAHHALESRAVFGKVVLTLV